MRISIAKISHLHHIRVVRRNANGQLDALGPQLILRRDEARQMALAAPRGERAGHRKNGHLLAPDELGEVHVLRFAVVGLSLLEDDGGEGVAHFHFGGGGHVERCGGMMVEGGR